MQRLRILRALTTLSCETWRQSMGMATETSTGFCQRWISGSAVAQYPIVEFPLAQTGEGIAECEVIKWLVKVLTPAMERL